jgi:regulator of sigma E protease
LKEGLSHKSKEVANCLSEAFILENFIEIINRVGVDCISFIVLLGVLVFIHEFGHFIVAKLLGVKVLKFSLGFPPAMFKRKWGETEYMLSWVPLGGYVKLLGEDPESDETIPPKEQARAFTNKPLISRIAIIAAGPISNFVLAMVLLCIAFMAGWPVLLSQVGEVVPSSPAMQAGLKPGDIITSINGKHIWRWEDMRETIEKSAGKQLTVTVKRDGRSLELKVTPALSNQKGIFGEAVGRIGVTQSGKGVQLGFAASLHEGVKFTFHLTKQVVVALVRLVRGEMSPKALSGPITIFQFSGETIRLGFLNYLFLISFISINLAIINLLPIPILDGGHIMFFLVEAVIRRPVTGKAREVAVQMGLLFIVFLVVLVFYNDISRIVTQGWSIKP